MVLMCNSRDLRSNTSLQHDQIANENKENHWLGI